MTPSGQSTLTRVFGEPINKESGEKIMMAQVESALANGYPLSNIFEDYSSRNGLTSTVACKGDSSCWKRLQGGPSFTTE